MHQVYLSIGSNIDPEYYIRSGVAELLELFAEVELSSIYRSPAVGFEGDPFLNLVAALKTRLQLHELAATLRALEYRYGRSLNSTKFSSRHLDIDILTFDTYCGQYEGITLPRPEVLENAYVLCPFAELAPGLILPEQRITLREHWERYSNPWQKVVSIGSVSQLPNYSDTSISLDIGLSGSTVDERIKGIGISHS